MLVQLFVGLRPLAFLEIAGLNPAGDMVVCLSVGNVVCCEARRSPLDRPIPRPEDSYRVWCVYVCVCVSMYVCACVCV